VVLDTDKVGVFSAVHLEHFHASVLVALACEVLVLEFEEVRDPLWIDLLAVAVAFEDLVFILNLLNLAALLQDGHALAQPHAAAHVVRLELGHVHDYVVFHIRVIHSEFGVFSFRIAQQIAAAFNNH